MTNPFLAHLYALRSQLEAVILSVEAAYGVPDSVPEGALGSCPNCGTPEDQLMNRDTLDGTKRRQCPKCGYQWDL